MRHPEFPVVSFLLIPLLLCSLPSHIRTGSVCVIALVIWLTTLNLIHAVNSLVWANNVIVRLQVWCDISTKILIGYTYAVPLSALCICRQLESVSSNRQVLTTIHDKRRRMKFEAAMCFGVPVIFMALHYVVQGHRFDLVEDFGCYPATYVSLAGLFLIWIPPLVISLITMVYATAAFCHFLKRRIEFAAILRSSNSALSPSRYFRLMTFAIFEILWDSGTNIYVIYFNVSLSGLRPWVSWENVHSNFSRVGTFPHFLLPPWVIDQFIWQWWLIPVSTLFFVIFFGFGEEARADYRRIILRICRITLRQDTTPSNSLALPIHSCTYPHNIISSTSSSVFSQNPVGLNPWNEHSHKAPDTPKHSTSFTDLSQYTPNARYDLGLSFKQTFAKPETFKLDHARPVSADVSTSTRTSVSISGVTDTPRLPPQLHQPSSPSLSSSLWVLSPASSHACHTSSAEGSTSPTAAPHRNTIACCPISYPHSLSSDPELTVSPTLSSQDAVASRQP